MSLTNFLNHDQISVGLGKALFLETVLGVVGAGIAEDNLMREAIGTSGGLLMLVLVSYFFFTRSLGWRGTIATFGRQ